jgi:hypothetical protein
MVIIRSYLVSIVLKGFPKIQVIKISNHGEIFQHDSFIKGIIP